MIERFETTVRQTDADSSRVVCVVTDARERPHEMTDLWSDKYSTA